MSEGLIKARNPQLNRQFTDVRHSNPLQTPDLFPSIPGEAFVNSEGRLPIQAAHLLNRTGQPSADEMAS
jgi:hypothetical protein